MSKLRFADIGIPFPLFEGPVEEASEYVGAGRCVVCDRLMPHCFELGIGAGIIKSCPQCGSLNGLDADDAEDVPCRSCRTIIEFPSVGDDAIVMCYECLRKGEGANSLLGMISWDQAFDRWQFCCRQPMTYIGQWSQAEFNAAAADGDGRALFDAIVQDAVDGLWDGRLHDLTGIYVFGCSACGRRTAHWDIA